MRRGEGMKCRLLSQAHSRTSATAIGLGWRHCPEGQNQSILEGRLYFLSMIFMHVLGTWVIPAREIVGPLTWHLDFGTSPRRGVWKHSRSPPLAPSTCRALQPEAILFAVMCSVASTTVGSEYLGAVYDTTTPSSDSRNRKVPLESVLSDAGKYTMRITPSLKRHCSVSWLAEHPARTHIAER